ncbi:MAG: putative Ig domain-containing protein, partial [Bacteroidota bacterium]
GEVGITPVARYSPAEELPFGWYTNVDGTVDLNEVAVQAGGIDEAQTLYPALRSGDDSFDPQGAFFGIYVESNTFNRVNYSEDDINTGGVAHRVRVYPVRERDGSLVDNSYLITFEDATNGDYQDYVYVLTNVAPYEPGALVLDFTPDELTLLTTNGTVSEPGTSVLSANGDLAGDQVSLEASEPWVVLPTEVTLGTPLDFAVNAFSLDNGVYEATVTASAPGYAPATLRITATVADEVVFSTRINFQDDSFAPPTGYLADEGAAYGDRGNGLIYGWIDPVTELPLDAFASARGAARDVTDASSDEIKRLHSLNMFDRKNAGEPRDWEIALPNGTYVVELAAGDPDFTDSRHTIRAEGVTVIDDFVPTLADFFAVGTATVEVLDGKLTLDDVGAGADELGNSKILYVNIAPLGEVNPTVLATLTGNQDFDGNYRGAVMVTLEATDNAQSGGIQSIRYSLDGGATFIDYTGTFTLTLPDGETSFDYLLDLEVTDANDNVGTGQASFTVVEASGALARIENMTKVPTTNRGFPADDYYTFYRFRNPGQAQVHDENVVRVHNDGTAPLIIDEAIISDVDNYTLEVLPDGDAPTELPLAIAVGEFRDLNVAFVADPGGGANAMIVETLTLNSNADNAADQTVTLHGGFAPQPEGGDEINAQEVFDAFGFQTSMLSIVNDAGTITPPNNITFRPSSNFPDPANVDAGHEGDLILADAFVQADPNQPVLGLQLSALHGGPGSNGARFVQVNGTGTVGNMNFSHGSEWYQSLLPKEGNNSTTINFDRAETIDGPFRIAVANYLNSGGNNINGNRPDLLGLRVYRVIDQDGDVIPNEYIVLQDFVQGGCGAGSANCDWNDNTFYFINIRPEAVPTAANIDDVTAQALEVLDYDITPFFDNGYAGNKLTYTATLADGSPLPSWIQLDGETGVFTVNAPFEEADNVFSIEVTATDYNLLTAVSSFDLTVDDENIDCTVTANADGLPKIIDCNN